MILSELNFIQKEPWRKTAIKPSCILKSTHSGIYRAGQWFSLLFFYLCIFVIVSTPGNAAEDKKELYTNDPTSTSWAKSKNARSRLLSAKLESDPKEVLGGIEIRLREKWKTYWRVPGDGGLPPRFDFSASENLQKAEILWPAPNRYVDRFGVAIGYKDRVIFPMRITPKDPKKPVKLKLKLDYAACEIVCIPLSANHDLTFSLGENLEGRHQADIKKFLEKVPQPISEVKNLKVIGMKYVSKSDRNYLVLDLRSRIGFRQPEIFIEGPEGLYFRAPKLNSKPSVVARWHIPISGNVDETPVIGSTLKMTFVDGQRRIEADYEIKAK